MKKFLVAVLAVTLSAPQAFAADPPPLKPGKAAGVHQAQLEDGTGMIVIAGVALIGIGIALAVAGNGTQPATSTTSTTP